MEDWQRNKIREIMKEKRDKQRVESNNEGGYSLALVHPHHYPAHSLSDWSLLNNDGGMGKALVAGIHLAKSLSIVEKKNVLHNS